MLCVLENLYITNLLTHLVCSFIAECAEGNFRLVKNTCMPIFIRWAPVAIFSCPFVKTLQVFTSAVIANRVLIALFILLNSNLSQDYAVRLFLKILIVYSYPRFVNIIA